MHAGRKVAEAIRTALPGYRGSPTPELGVSRSGRGRKVRKTRESTPSAEPPAPEPQEATIESLRELQVQAQALHLAFPEQDVLQEAIACFTGMQVRMLSRCACASFCLQHPLTVLSQCRKAWAYVGAAEACGSQLTPAMLLVNSSAVSSPCWHPCQHQAGSLHKLDLGA